MNTISNIRLRDLELERRRLARGILTGLALSLALWYAVIVAVVALL